MSKTRSRVQALLLAAVLLAGAGGAAGWPFSGSSKEQAMLDWITAKKGVVNVAIETRDGVRGTFATRDVGQDELLAKIPMSTAIFFPANTDFAELGVTLLRHGAASGAARRYGPYLDALPMLHDTAAAPSYESFPPEYLHLVDSHIMADHIRESQDTTTRHWAHSGRQLAQEGFTLEHLRAALNTVTTRYFGISHRGESMSVMIPLLDFANHYDNCTNRFEYRPCGFSEADAAHEAETGEVEERWTMDAVGVEDLCCFWRAGAAVKAGQEVCNRYGYLAPDQAFFQYGFIPPEEPPPLSRVDLHDYSRDYIIGARAHEEPVEFKGDAEELREERERIVSRIDYLEQGLEAEAATKPAPSDPQGILLASLKELRQRRLFALRAEAARLARKLAEAGSKGKAPAGGAAHKGGGARDEYEDEEGDEEL